MKVLFLDYDGTLRVPNTDQVSKESITSLDTIRKRGNLAFINTGRCYYSIGNQVEHLPIDGLICGCGTYIRHHDTVLYEVKANAIQKEKVVHALRQYQVDAFLEGHAGLFMDQRYSDYTNRVVAFFEKQGVYMRPVNADDFEFSKMSLYYKSEEQKRNFEKALQKDFDFITFPNLKAEAVLRHHSKATGMKKILNELHLPMESSIAFGDSDNDEDMLKAAHCSVLIGDNAPHLSEWATIKAPSADDEGITWALQKMNLLD